MLARRCICRSIGRKISMQVAMDDVIDLDDLGELPTITPNQVENLYLCYELTQDLRRIKFPFLLLLRNFYLKKFTLDQFFFPREEG